MNRIIRSFVVGITLLLAANALGANVTVNFADTVNQAIAGEDIEIKTSISIDTDDEAFLLSNGSVIAELNYDGQFWRTTLTNITPAVHNLTILIIDSDGGQTEAGIGTGLSIGLDDKWTETIIPFEINVLPMNLKFNFGGGNVNGFITDYGNPYSTQSVTLPVQALLDFGWSASLHNLDPVDVLNGIDSRTEFDSYRFMRGNGYVADWELQVPNGSYLVDVWLGDSSYGAERFKVEIEGVSSGEVLTKQSTSYAGWHAQVTKLVNVTDGKLTLRDTGSYQPAKLNFLSIQQVFAPDASTLQHLNTYAIENSSIYVSALGNQQGVVKPPRSYAGTFDSHIDFLNALSDPWSNGTLYSFAIDGDLQDFSSELTIGNISWTHSLVGSIAYFGQDFGGSPLYTNTPYSFFLSPGNIGGVGNADEEIRIQTYRKSDYSLVKTTAIDLDDLLIQGDSLSSAERDELLSGLTLEIDDTTDTGLKTIVSLSRRITNTDSPDVMIWHTAYSSDYIYVIETNSKARYGVNESATKELIINENSLSLGADRFTPVYTLSFSEDNIGITEITKQSAFGQSLLPFYLVGKEHAAVGNAARANLNSAQLTHLSSHTANPGLIWSGGPYTFDGTANTVIETPEPIGITGNSPFSMSANVVPGNNSSVSGYGKGLIGWGLSGANQGNFLYYNSDEQNFEYGFYSNDDQTPGDYPQNTGYHIAVTYDGTTQRIYINGNEVPGTSRTPGPLNMQNTPARIGADPLGQGRYFEGTMDDVRIYNYALTPDEIFAVANLNPIAPTTETDVTSVTDVSDSRLDDFKQILDRSGELPHNLIWSEDFSDLADGTTTDEGSSGWMATADEGNFEVINQRLEAHTHLADGNGEWVSEVIDISGDESVAISIDTQSFGPLEDSDYIYLYYRLEGGDWKEFGYRKNNFSADKYERIVTDGISGNELEIRILCRVTAEDERYYFDNIKVFVSPSLTDPMTPELRSHTLLDRLIEKYNYDPIALTNYVINEIELTDELSYSQSETPEISLDPGGVQRSALGVLVEKQGSPMEQCALLVYLLRKCGIPAAYATAGRNQLLMDKDLLSSMLRLNFRQYIRTPPEIPVNYPWVAAFIDPDGAGGNPGKWVHLFPWLKDIEVEEGFDLFSLMPDEYNTAWEWVYQYFLGNEAVLPYRFNDTTDEVRQVIADPLPFEYRGLDQLADYDQPAVLFPRFVRWQLRDQDLDINLDEDVGMNYSYRNNYYSRWEDFPLPTYAQGDIELVAALSEYPDIFDTVRYIIYGANYTDDSETSNSGVLIDTGDIYVCDLHNRKLIVENIPEGNIKKVKLSLAAYDTYEDNNTPQNFPVDYNLVSSLNGSFSASMTHDKSKSVLHIIKRKNRTQTNFANSLLPFSDTVFEHPNPMDTDLPSPLQFPRSSLDYQWYWHLDEGVYGICSNFGSVSREMLTVHGEELTYYERQGGDGDATIERDTRIYLMGMHYWEYLSRFKREMADLLKVRFINDSGTMLAGLDVDADGTPVFPKVDIFDPANFGELVNGSFDLTKNLSSNDAYRDFFYLVGCQGSAYEHGAINRYFGQLGAVSTMRVFHLAKERGDPLYMATPSDWPNQVHKIERMQNGAITITPVNVNNLSIGHEQQGKGNQAFVESSHYISADQFLADANHPQDMIIFASKYYKYFDESYPNGTVFQLECAGLAPIPYLGTMGGTIYGDKYEFTPTHTVEVKVSHAERGDVRISNSEWSDYSITLTQQGHANVRIEARSQNNPDNVTYPFSQWNDGNTSSNRTVYIDRDRTYTANFNLPKLPKPDFRIDYFDGYSTTYTRHLHVKPPVEGCRVYFRAAYCEYSGDFNKHYLSKHEESSIALDKQWYYVGRTYYTGYSPISRQERCTYEFRSEKDGYIPSDWVRITGYTSGYTDYPSVPSIPMQ